jgi:hypothetical protein
MLRHRVQPWIIAPQRSPLLLLASTVDFSCLCSIALHLLRISYLNAIAKMAMRAAEVLFCWRAALANRQSQSA